MQAGNMYSCVRISIPEWYEAARYHVQYLADCQHRIRWTGPVSSTLEELIEVTSRYFAELRPVVVVLFHVVMLYYSLPRRLDCILGLAVV